MTFGLVTDGIGQEKEKAGEKEKSLCGAVVGQRMIVSTIVVTSVPMTIS